MPAALDKRTYRSPLLHQILHGGGGVALNLLRHGARDDGAQFFDNTALNQSVIFKYPRFEYELENDSEVDYATQNKWLSICRPIETAIYVPQMLEAPERGGYAIYMRQRNYPDLIREHIGIEIDDVLSPSNADIVKLKIIDEIPSLDPFLLKATFDQYKIAIPPVFLRLAREEEVIIKTMITQRIMPVVGRALDLGPAEIRDKCEKFVQAIWNPGLPEASLFTEALRLERRQAGPVFIAWKGITFYQLQFERGLEKIREILHWLGTTEAVPYDMHLHMIHRDQHEMFKATVERKLRNAVSKVKQVLHNYDFAYRTLVDGNDPLPFRDFLVTANARYWVLGYCCMCMNHCRNIFDRSLSRSNHGMLSFAQFGQLLSNMDTVLNSQTALDYRINP